MLSIFVRDRHLSTFSRGWRRLRPFCSLLNPGSQRAALIAAERIRIGRHPLVRVGCFDTAYQFTFPRIARGDGWFARIALSQSSFATVESQTPLLLVRTVAFPAILLQNRLHIARKVHT